MMSAVVAFILGPLLWIAFAIFAAGVIVKFALYFLTAARDSRTPSGIDRRLLISKIAWLLLPISPAFGKKPVGTSSRYLFHVCLIVGPLLLGSHVALVEASRLGWRWPTFPDPLSRILTWVVLLGCGAFLLRRLVVARIRAESKMSHFAFIAIVLTPFVTGRLLTDPFETFEPGAFWRDPGGLGVAHAASSAVLLVVVAFLYMQVKYRRALCTTCGACSLRCPVGAIKMSQDGATRSLSYRAKACVHCETCVTICPEGAAYMEHVISAAPFYSWGFKEAQRTPLAFCEVCKQAYRPVPQVEKVRQLVAHGAVSVCPACKRRSHIRKMKLSRS
jgi:ferredoxin